MDKGNILMDQPVVGNIEVGLEVAGHDGEAKGHNGHHGVETGRLELIRRHAESIQNQKVVRFPTSPHYMYLMNSHIGCSMPAYTLSVR